LLAQEQSFSFPKFIGLLPTWYLLFSFKSQFHLLLFRRVALFLNSEACAKVLFRGRKFFKFLFWRQLRAKEFLLLFLVFGRRPSITVGEFRRLLRQVFALACVRKKMTSLAGGDQTGRQK
jgi:hypothetical protein